MSFHVNYIKCMEFNLHKSIDNPVYYKLAHFVFHKSKELKSYDVQKTVEKFDSNFFFDYISRAITAVVILIADSMPPEHKLSNDITFGSVAVRFSRTSC